jgi:ubiquinone/menaquinone biosynthesis C-methylase UbiE
MDEIKLKTMAAQLRKPEGEEGIKTGESMNKGNRFINLDTIRIVDPSPRDIILEVGMGNGMFVKNILEEHESINYTGFDYSELMVREATRLNAAWVEKGNAKFVLGNVSQLPFAAGSFNKIFTINTIYFWEDNAKVLKELRRVLKPNGKLIIAIRPRHQMENYPFTKYGFTMYSRPELEEVLIQNRFSILKVHEIREPDFEFNGTVMSMESIIVEATPL